jgi:hypothetical protein
MQKPPTMTNINDSSLIQLANRVGRNNVKIPYAFIHVNSQDVEHVQRAMSTDPAKFTSPLDQNAIRRGLKSTCNIDGLYMKFKNLMS